MASTLDNYYQLRNYTECNCDLRQQWIKLLTSFDNGISDQISRLGINPNNTLPPIFKFTKEQREVYWRLYNKLPQEYQQLADITLGAAIPTDDSSQKLVDIINWIDRNTIWDFRVIGTPKDLTQFVMDCFKYVVLSSEAGQREVEDLKKLLKDSN